MGKTNTKAGKDTLKKVRALLPRARRRGRPQGNIGPRPDIFKYHDCHTFLRDWEAHQKKLNRDFSLRSLSEAIGFSSSYIPLVFARTRALTLDVAEKLVPALELNPVEAQYFEALRALSEGTNDDERQSALARLQDFWRYRRENPKEHEAFRYLTHWHCVAIREMAALKEFRADPEWIHAQLVYPVPPQKIAEALEFLLEHGLLERAEDGRILHTKRPVHCEGGIYRLVMSKFHHQMLGMAADSITSIAREDRNVVSYTLSIREETFPEVTKIMNRALEEIAALGASQTERDSVYHVALAAFPLIHLKKTEN